MTASAITDSALNLPHRSLRWFHWLILASTVALTLGAWYVAKNQVRENTQQRFEFRSDLLVRQVQERMSTYEDALWSGVAMMQAQENRTDYAKWKRFTKNLNLPSRYKDINGIGVIYYITPEKLPAYLAAQRTQRPDYQIHPQHARNEHWPIAYIEPDDVNAKAVGLDIAFEDHLLAGAQRSRDTGTAQITASIMLGQDGQKTPGVLFYAPFYDRPDLLNEEDRRAHFIGMVYAPLIVGKLVDSVLPKNDRQVIFSIRDGNQTLYDELSAANPDVDPNPLFSKQTAVTMYGRTWVFQLQTAKSFRALTLSHQPGIILVGGFIINALLLASFVLLARANLKAKIYALNMTQEVRQANAHLESVFQSSPLALLIVDSNGRIVKASANAALLFGHTLDTLVGMSVESLMPARYRAQHPHLRDTFLAAPSARAMGAGLELFGVRKDGREVPIEIGLNRVETAAGTMVLTAIADLTERQRASSEITRLAERLEIAKRAGKIGVWDWDLVSQSLVWDDIMFQVYGIAREQFDNAYDAWLRGVHPDDQAYANEAIQAALRDDAPYDIEFRVCWPDGSIHHVKADGIVVRDQNGKPIRMTGTNYDITERKLASEQLAEHGDMLSSANAELVKSNMALTRSNQELDDFAYIASHDMKEPLRGISNYAAFLLEDYADKLDEEGKSKLRTLQKLSARMGTLVDNLLHFSRVGRVELAIQPTSLNALVDEVEDALSVMLQEQNATIKRPAALPTVVCDHVRVLEVLRNLITNAVKYNQQAEKMIEIGALPGDVPIIYVRDNGIGIDLKHKDRIFEMFKRLHARDAYGGGMGAGLALVKKIVERHGGRIWIESTVGQGSTFFFTLAPNAERAPT